MSDSAAAATAPASPVLVNVLGPPAVGKMTVGHELAARTGLRLFHNHLTIDLVTRFFEFGTPPFLRLVGSIRQQILAEVAASSLPGAVFTYVWAFDEPDDEAEIARYAAPFRDRGLRVLYVELEATQEERLRRNRTQFRLTHKPSKRDLDWSDAHLVEMDQRYRMSSGGAFDARDDWLRIDIGELSPEATAERIIDYFGLARVGS